MSSPPPRRDTTMVARIAGFIAIAMIASAVFAVVKRGRPASSSDPSPAQRRDSPSSILPAAEDADAPPRAAFYPQRVERGERGTLEVAGEIENLSELPLDPPRLLATLKGASEGAAPAAAFVPFDLLPGQRAPVIVRFDLPGDGVLEPGDLEVRADVREHRGLPLAPALETSILATEEARGGGWRVSGMVENRGQRRATRVTVWVASYRDGAVEDMHSRPIGDLDPGARIPFEVRVATPPILAERPAAPGEVTDAGTAPRVSAFATGTALGQRPQPEK